MKNENSMRYDPIFAGFLKHEFLKGMNMRGESGLLDLSPVDRNYIPRCRAYTARFTCNGLVKKHDGNIIEADDFMVAILFPLDYLRRANTFDIVKWIKPNNIFHPNIRPPHICMGHITPGMGLTEILHQIADIISYRKVTMIESDSLNKEACGWARKNAHRFPIDNRPMKRRSLNVHVDPILEEE